MVMLLIEPRQVGSSLIYSDFCGPTNKKVVQRFFTAFNKEKQTESNQLLLKWRLLSEKDLILNREMETLGARCLSAAVC
jgi:hypothetical protein